MSTARTLIAAALTLATLTLPARASAQLLDAKVISLQAARTMVAACEAEARRNNWNVSIAVVNAAGELLIFSRMDEAPSSSVEISQGKARTAASFRRPTRLLDSAMTAGRLAYLAFPGAIPVEGGVPVIVGGKVIGAVGVSGATSQQDGQVAQAGVRALVP
jgi:glc operon protein GlcG